MILDEVLADIQVQLNQQAELGIRVRQESDVPEVGPANSGVWFQIPQVTAVFADMKGSTELTSAVSPRVAARAYTYFIRGMAVILERFSARYVDIQGDGIFGLFSGKGSAFYAASCAITMRTQVERDISVRFNRETSSDWELRVGVGIDQGRLLVRRLGLRGTKQNEVWAGKPVNIAAKLSSLADPNQIAVSERVFNFYENASKLRQRALIWSCGCDGYTRQGLGFDDEIGTTTNLWEATPAPDDLGLDFDTVHRLKSAWCKTHGPEFCEAVVTGKRP